MRKQARERELARFVDVLLKDDDIKKIVVFGALASGDIHEWSDIDLVVVKETNRRFIERFHRLRAQLGSKEAADLVVYTPAKFKAVSATRRFVRDEIVNKGCVVYDRAG